MSERSTALRAHAERALMPWRDEIKTRGLSGQVRIVRDKWGVSHVQATTVTDAYFGQGFAVAADRLFQVDLALRTATGTVAELLGEGGLALDRWSRVLGCHTWIEPNASRLADLDLDIAAAWGEGVNAYISAMPVRPVEYELLGVDPDLPSPEMISKQVHASWLAALVVANLDMELLRVAVAEQVGWQEMWTLLPPDSPEARPVAAGKTWGSDPSQTALALLAALPKRDPAVGSNCWVVDGSRTASGKPLVGTDSHVGFAVPSLYYETHLSAPGLEVSGATVPHSPGVYLGRTPTTAWAMTSAAGDDQDLFVEHLNNDGTAARHAGGWEPLRVRREEIVVRGRSELVVMDVRETRHGPLLDPESVAGGGIGAFAAAPLSALAASPQTAYSLQWAHRDNTFGVGTMHRMATAKDFEQFRRALEGWQVTQMHVVFADSDGNIGYQLAGRWPVRGTGDGTVPSPGWTGTHDWVGYLPFEEQPYSYNPPEGFLVTANNRTWADTYPHVICQDALAPYRARRISELLCETEQHTTESFAAMHDDTVSLQAKLLVPFLLDATITSDRGRYALDTIRQWDFDVTAESGAAAIYEVWLVHLGRKLLAPRLGAALADLYIARKGPEGLRTLLRYPSKAWFGAHGPAARNRALGETLETALDELEQLLGSDMEAWRWGGIHRLDLVHSAAAFTDDPDVVALFTAGSVEPPGDHQTVNNGGYMAPFAYLPSAGAGWRHIIDLADPDAAVGVAVAGQSGNPTSPHFSDMVELRFTTRYHPLPLSREAVEAAAQDVITLQPLA